MRTWGARHPERGDGLQRSRLHPVDANRFLVTDVVLEADVDEIAALDHLLGRLGKADLVTVDRRDGKEARQEQHQAGQRQEQDRTPLAGRCELERHEQPAARMRRFYRLLPCSEAPGLEAIHHGFRIR
ncbi:hypothetical protein ABIF23_002384 [Bradyrhizobium elkanii]